MILWTRGMQFLHTLWHILHENSKQSRSGSKKNVQKFFFKKNHFSSHWSSVILEHIFENHAERNLQNPKTFSLEVQKTLQNPFSENSLLAMKMIIWISTTQL